MEKYCVNCVHHFQIGLRSKCGNAALGTNLVTGSVRYSDAEQTRADHNMCGAEGNWFIPKESGEKKKGVLAWLKNVF